MNKIFYDDTIAKMSVFVGNVTTDTIRFENINVGFVTNQKVGIANVNPANTLDIGSNVSVSDTASNTIAVKGNVAARYYYGDAGFMSNVQFRESNVVQSVIFSNATTSITTYSNVGISNLSPVNTLDIGSKLSVSTTQSNILVVRGAIKADDGYFISNLNPNTVYTGEFSNATTAFVTVSKAGISNLSPQHTLDIGSNISIDDSASNAVVNVLGNVSATYYYGDGRYLSNVVVFAAANIVGNVMTDTIEFRDPEVAFVTYKKAGIANLNPQNTLDVGSNLSVDDLASNVVSVKGNVAARYFTGDGRYLTNVVMTANLASVSILGADTTSTIGMYNPDLSFVTTGVRAGISNQSPIHTLDVGSNLYINDTSDDVLVVHGNILSTGNIMVTGNITATYFAGDGTLIQNVTSNTTFTTAVNRANYTSNVVQFRNPNRSFVAYGPASVANALPVHTLDIGSNVYIQDDAPNVLVVRGVIVASAFIGDGNGVSNVVASTDLEVTVNAGNVTSNTVQFANATTAFVTYSNVGLSNLDPQHTLDVGSNLYVQDDAGVESILTVTGNVSAYYFKGDGRYLSNVPTCSICSTLNYVTNIGNTTANTVRFVENTVSLITESNVGIANEFPIHTMDIGSNIYLNDSTDTTIFTTGNIISNYIIADGSRLYNLSATLDTVINNGNVTSNIATFTHPTECIVVASNIKMDGDLYITSPMDSSIRLGAIDTDGPVHSPGLSNTNRIAIGTEAGQLGQYQQAVAIGMRAGNQGQGESSVAIGIQAGESLQRNYAMALGFGAGNDSQNAHAIAIGYRAGLSFQNVFSTAIGSNAGSWYQESNAMAIGEDAGYSNQSFRATAIGSLAGRNDQGQSATAIGYRAGDRTQGSYSLAVGNFAGSNVQGANCIALGSEAGYDNQGTNAFALGLRAGYWFQGEDAIALGVYAGLSNQDSYAIAIGNRAGQFNQNVNTLAIGTEAGRTSQNVSAFAVGHYAGWNSQGINAHALGHYAGYTSQGMESLAVGLNAGYSKQGEFAFALGTESGYDNQGANAVAIGMRAGYTSQGTSSVAIGHQAGMTSQSMNAVAIGIQSGMTNQGETAMAIGIQSGMTSQGANAFALGEQAGMTSQGIDAYAIGFQAGMTSQGMAAYAIGKQSGFDSQGANAIAIGFQSGMNNQGIYSLAFGSEAGSNAQGSNSIGIGHQSSFDTQGDYSIAVGFQSGYTQQLHKSISIGYKAGLTSQNSNALAIGTESGYSLQGPYSISVGHQSGYSNQMGGIAIGPMSGYSDQQDNAFAVGYNAGYTSQGKNAVAIGVEAGYSIQNNQSISIGYKSGYSNQTGGIAIGTEAGSLNQRSNAVAIGIYSGYSEQQENAFAVGYNAGYTSQGKNAIAIGVEAGYSIQNNQSISIGYKSGYSNQTGGIAIGTEAGSLNQRSNAVAIGIYSGYSEQQENAFAVGYNAGYTSQGKNAIAIGVEAGYSIQNNQSISIGYKSGYSNQTGGIAIGTEAGSLNQRSNAVAIGIYSGYSEQQENAFAVGYNAGYTSQGKNAIAIGVEAGYSIQNNQSISIGYKSGYSNQTGGIAIGTEAGSLNQRSNATAIGIYAGYSEQQENAFAVGYNAGYTSQGKNAIAIGVEAGYSIQNNQSISIGYKSGYSNQTGGIAIGTEAGSLNQRSNATAIGIYAGYSEQQENAFAVGYNAGYTSQGKNAVAIGVEAGYSIQNNQSISIGYKSGYSNQTGGIAIGTEAGSLNQRSNAVAIGIYAGYSEQQENAFAVGFQSGYTSQGKHAIAIGVQSGYSIQDDKSIAIGHQSGYSNQTGGIAIGTEAGKIDQGSNATAIGIYAGYSLQSQNAFAVGYKSGYTSQGVQTVAIGVESGYSRQGAYSVALGYRAGYSNQTRSGVAIGQESGYISQGANAVAIGTYAGYSLQGTNSIAIGKNAGYLSTGLNSISIGENANAAHNYTIVLNATGNNMRSSQTGGFFVNPVKREQNQKQFSTIMSYTPNNEVITNDCITLTATGNIQISGNLLVTGDFATITSNNSIVNDSIVLFGNNNNFGTLDLGIVFFRGGQANVGMGYREDEKTYMIGHTLASPYSVDLVPDMGNNFTMNVYGSMTVTNTAWIAKNEDVTSYIGRAAVGYAGSTDFATFAHHDRNTVNDYAIGHNSAGATLINARATELIDFRLGNSSKMRMHSTGNVTIGTVTTQNYNLWVAGLLGVASRMDVGRDTDAASNIGRATIGYNTSDSDVATFSHIDRNSGVNYALGQTSAGETWLNSSAGQATIFRVNDVEKMRLHSNGNVGIGVTNPAHPLDIVGDIRSTTRIRAGENTDTTSYIGRAAVGYNGSSDWATFAHYDRNSSVNHALSQNASGLTQVNASTGQAILLKINDVEKMRVASNGNVGILNTTPVFPLDVIGDIRSSTRIHAGEDTDTTSYIGRAAVGYNTSDSDVATFAHYDRNSAANYALGQTAAGETWLNSSSGQAVIFRVNDVEEMRLHSNGNVGIGVTDPAHPLDIVGDIRSSTRIRAGEDTDTVSFIGRAAVGFNSIDSDVATFAHYDRNSDANYALGQTAVGETWLNSSSGQAIIFRVSDGEQMRLHSNGNVGIGTTGPIERLHVNGRILASGDIIAFSDARIKENVRPIENALEKVNSIGGYTYNKIGETSRSAGVIAQEIMKVLPEVVHGSEDTQYSVAYGNITSILIEAIKELSKQVDELREQIKKTF